MRRLKAFGLVIAGAVSVSFVVMVLHMGRNREMYTMSAQVEQNDSVSVNRVLAMVIGISVIDPEEIGKISGKWMPVENLYEIEKKHKRNIGDYNREAGLLVWIDLINCRIDVRRNEVLVGSASWSKN